MPVLTESFLEFAKRQDCPYVNMNAGMSMRTSSGGDAAYLFENGAKSNGINHLEPPAHPIDLTKAQLKYTELALELEVKQFIAFKREIQQAALRAKQYENLPSPGPEALEQLKAGAERIENLSLDIKVLRARLNKLTGFEEQLAQKTKDRNQRMDQADQTIADVNAIQLPKLPESDNKTHYEPSDNTFSSGSE